jgi:hypothetical protein
VHTEFSRRELLHRCGSGLGMTALACLLQEQGLLGTETGSRNTDPLSPRQSHFQASAQAVIWIFVNGGHSQVDTWDYKPELIKRDGQRIEGFDKHTGFFINAIGPLMKSPFEFTPRGECGKMISSIFPQLGRHADKMAFLHSLYSESNNHSPALFMMNSGLPRMGFPSVGSWVTYGLGSENRNLPGFVVMSDPKGRGLPKGHSLNWSSGFLPGSYQGTWLKPDGVPIDNLRPMEGVSPESQQRQLDLLARLNRRHLEKTGSSQELETRIKSFELAYRMQSAAPEALNIDDEPEHVHKLYGIGEPSCDHFARQCLVARRMVQRGVRFVQLYSGGNENARSWDGHVDIHGNHTQFAGETDKPVAGLLDDLQQQGLLDSTLVVWCGEFGRLPISQPGAKPGRDHNPHANTAWLAGGGIKGGSSYGETDEIGHKAAVDRLQVHDLHATILHMLGLDHERLTYFYNGRDFRLTDVAGRVIREIIA